MKLKGGNLLPIFIIERNFAEQLAVTPQGATVINQINDDENVNWLISFLGVDKKKTFCLYEAPSEDAITQAAQRLGIPADVIVEVGEEILSNGAINPLNVERFAE